MKTSTLVPLLSIALPCLLCADEPPKPPPLWAGKAEASYVATSGNTDTKTLGAAGEAEYQPLPWSAKVRFAYIHAESDGVDTANSFLGLLRGARKLSARLETFAEGDYFHDEFAGIDHRTTLQGGLSYLLIAPDPHSLKIDGGVGYTWEDRTDGENRDFAIGRLGLLYVWKISKTAEFSEEAVFTESFKDSSDWRFANVASISAGITTVLSVKVSYAISTLNEPVPGKKKTDTITSAALVTKF
jgi:putative salt-induced outer membrane protein YdiY